jgi:hypothetical protein
MTKACTCLAGLAALALTVSVAVVPAPAHVRVLPVAPPPHDRVQPYAHTAIGAVIEANGWQVPATGTELTAALAKLGNFVQLPVTFSAVALHSGLANPRVIITMRPSSSGQSVQVAPSSGGWGSSGSFQVAGPLGLTPANKPYLEGRLFLAANTEPGERGPVIKTAEFISWNSRKQKFDFGVIEGMGEKPELKFLDGARCFSCHKNRGPILGVAPWSNTAHNDLVRSTSAPLFKFDPLRNNEGKQDPAFGFRNDIDGLLLLKPSGPEVDAAVRQGADVLRDRERFRLLVRTAAGRKAFVMLLSALATRDPLDKLDQKLKIDLNQLDLAPFLRDAHMANKVAAPSTLADFSPAGPVNRPISSKLAGVTVNQVTKYDALRAQGNVNLPSEFQPSNPKAFVRPTAGAPTQVSQLVSAVALARAIGLSEDDRTFLATVTEQAVQKLATESAAPAAVAKAVFTGPYFADVLKDGVLPERDDFKDRFAAGLVEVLKSQFKADKFWHDRTKFASAPRFDPNAAEQEIEVLPSHACLRCHDIRTGAKPTAFNPIPLLAFDPFDVAARDAWLKTADRKRKVEVLGRMLKRLGSDKDMPPEDSTEAELYRVKDPAALTAVKEWLDAELKKAK